MSDASSQSANFVFLSWMKGKGIWRGNGVRRPAAWPGGGGWRTISSAMRNFHQQASPSDSASGYYRHAHVAA